MTLKPQIISLASGSKANCTLVSSGNTHVLIDFGLSCKRVKSDLVRFGINLCDVSAVFITHEHSDHVAGLPTFMKNHSIPVYITHPSYISYIRGKGFDCKNDFTITDTDFCMQVGDLKIEAMPVRHDSAACVAYRITGGGISLGICTDAGKPTDELFEFFRDCESVITEANYDEAMLICGPYSQVLKYRIMGERGHTSNVDCARFVSRLAKAGVKRVLLAHISPENNTHDLALHEVAMEMRRNDAHLDFLAAAPRDEALVFQLS